MALFGDKTPKPDAVSEIDRDISDLESKKQKIMRIVQNEADAINTLITTRFTELGTLVYELHQEGACLLEAFAEQFDEISTLKKQAEEKTAKVSEISVRYDEDIALLRSLQPEAVAETPHGESKVCDKCGAACPENGKFCRNCGNKLTR